MTRSEHALENLARFQLGGHNRLDLSGQRFGRLTAIARDGKKYGKTFTWFCLCDCGTMVDGVLTGNLTKGNTRSCGCLLREFNSQYHGRPKVFSRKEIQGRYRRKHLEALRASGRTYANLPHRRAISLAWKRTASRNLNGSYIRHVLKQQGMRATNIPAPLIEAKRVHLKVVRLLKEKHHET